MKEILNIILFFLISINAWALPASLGIDGEYASQIGIYIKDLSSGEVIENQNAEKVFLPASVMKAITCAAALEKLGNDFRFNTPIYLYGQRAEDNPSVWHGNLIIESCADPTIDSKQFKERQSICSEIVGGLKRLGITQIDGRIIVTENLQDAGCNPKWEIDDVPWSYGAGLYGLNYLDNTFALWPATGRTIPEIPNLKIHVIPSQDGNDLIRGIMSNEIIILAKDPTNVKWRTLAAMENPAEIFSLDLFKYLKSSGITVKQEEIEDKSNRTLVYEHLSPFISDILREMMVESHNLFAEGMLRALAPSGTRDDAISAERKLLDSLGIHNKYNNISDGSGLARANALQPRFISSVLEKMAKGQYAREYVSFFPKAGEEGTVKLLLSKSTLKGKLALKSGSMSGVQCFAGYKLDDEGNPTHTVVILVNIFFCSRSNLRKAIENLLIDTFTSI